MEVVTFWERTSTVYPTRVRSGGRYLVVVVVVVPSAGVVCPKKLIHECVFGKGKRMFVEKTLLLHLENFRFQCKTVPARNCVFPRQTSISVAPCALALDVCCCQPFLRSKFLCVLPVSNGPSGVLWEPCAAILGPPQRLCFSILIETFDSESKSSIRIENLCS